MAKRILVIDPLPEALAITQECLKREGYEVITADSGAEGLEKAKANGPHLVMVDAMLPDMGWNQVGRTLRAGPRTAHIAIVILTAQKQLIGLKSGQEVFADDFLVKPFSASELQNKLLPLLAEKDEAKQPVISTGNGELDAKMGGGIPLGSLTLIEGSSGAGKSVLVQQMIWGSLQDAYELTIFTTENTVKSLSRQMRSLSLDVLDFLLLNRLRVYPVETARMGKEAPAYLLRAMKTQKQRDMIFVDSLTSAIASCSDADVLGYFEESKRLCSDGMTVVVVLHSHAVSSDLLIRIRSLCDAHLQVRTEELSDRLVKTLEVTKIRGAARTTGNIISFEVEPGWGMRLIPVNRVKG